MNAQRSDTKAIKPLLKQIGLDDKEIEVYLTILALKTARASTIAKAAKQSRSHTYLVLRSLAEKGLVSEVERGKVLHFVAEPPKRLLGYLEDREEEIERIKPLVASALPFLDNFAAPLVGQPRVTLSYGQPGMKALYRDVLREDYCALFNAEAMYTVFEENVMLSLFPHVLDFHGRDLVVNNASAERFAEEMAEFEDHQVRVLPEGLHFSTDTIVFGDRIALFAYDDDRTIVQLENRNLTQTFRAVFEWMWGMSTEL